MTNTMTNLLNKRDALETNFRCTGNPAYLRRIDSINEEIICELEKCERKRKASDMAFNVLRVTLMAICLFMIVYTSAMLVRSIGFKFMYAVDVCFLGFFADCGIDWLQARMKKA